MKLYVKRDSPTKNNKIAVFQKAKIEIYDSGELATLKMALDHYLKWMKENGWDKDQDKDILEMYERTEKALKELQQEEQW